MNPYCRAYIALLCMAPSAQATPLISEGEAARAPVLERSRAVTRGPRIELEAPQDPVTSPFTFHVRFVPHGGAKVDATSVHVVLLREPMADLTSRLHPFVTPAGINLGDAEAPAGHYDLRIELRDDAGHLASDIVHVDVARSSSDPHARDLIGR